MYPRFLVSLDENLQPLTVNVRVGQAVDVVAQAGRPKTITGWQTQSTPVLLAYGERAELEDEEYISLSSTLEGLVILRKVCYISLSAYGQFSNLKYRTQSGKAQHKVPRHRYFLDRCLTEVGDQRTKRFSGMVMSHVIGTVAEFQIHHILPHLYFFKGRRSWILCIMLYG
jgi:hypothetical protein